MSLPKVSNSVFALECEVEAQCVINMWHSGFKLNLRQELIYKFSNPEAVIHSLYKAPPDILIIKVSD